MGGLKGEWERIDRIRRLAPIARAPGVVLGIGDDAAIFRPRGSREDLLFTTDLLIEDVHFRRETHAAPDVGWKALARGLSDIAAMGGEPRFFLVSLAVPRWADDRWVDGFYRGMMALARRARMTLAGGDLARGERLTCDIVVCGAAPRGTALRRDRARTGHGIYVSGRLGGSALGLDRGPALASAWRRHLRPEPRLALGRFLRQRLGASSAMDLSDGLSLDLARLCLASQVSAAIHHPPRFPGASPEQALHGGEDYELLFTAPRKARVPAKFEGIPITRIGTMQKGPAGTVLLEGTPLAPLGWDHFLVSPAKVRHLQ
jgi:thiamine-monophosphate kinase